MDYKEINNILDKYFEGLSGLDEEKRLRQYFASNEISQEHLPYKPLFEHYKSQTNVTNPRRLRLEYKQPKKNYKLAIAAVLLIGLGLFSIRQNRQNKQLQFAANETNKKEAFKEIKKYSKKINKSFDQAGSISIFAKTTKKIFNVKNK